MDKSIKQDSSIDEFYVKQSEEYNSSSRCIFPTLIQQHHLNINPNVCTLIQYNKHLYIYSRRNW